MNTTNTLPPPPNVIDLNLSLNMWVIEDMEIWAKTYDQAIEIYNLTKY